MLYTHNSDPTYYFCHTEETNCGSYALRLKEWYSLDEAFEDEVEDIAKWIEDLYEEGYDNDEITDLYTDILVEQIKKDFGDQLIKVPYARAPSTKDKELIAFATVAKYVEDNEYSYWDFHFRVYRDNKWMEKCGSLEVDECNLDDWGRYTSKIVYFWHEIGECNESK